MFPSTVGLKSVFMPCTQSDGQLKKLIGKKVVVLGTEVEDDKAGILLFFGKVEVTLYYYFLQECQTDPSKFNKDSKYCGVVFDEPMVRNLCLY